jgi:DNA-binding Xre family transcriptional regulator
MKDQSVRHKSATEFGKSIGLSEIEMELIRQKKRLIEKLKIVRKKKKISQSQLAFLVGSKQPAIARMESGLVSQVSFDFLARVAIALEVNFTFKYAA